MTQNTKGAGASLKPCPFCGGKPEMYYPFHLMGKPGHAAKYHGGVRCTQCRCESKATTPVDGSISSWNARAPTDEQPEAPAKLSTETVDKPVDMLSAPTAEQAEGVRVDQLQAEIDRLNAIINTPQSDDFLRSVSIEAEHQRQRWGAEGDAGKTPADWFWLVGYLGGKALHAHAADNVAKAEHHIITTAAALANWHLNMFGKTNMRPGIAAPAASTGEQV